MFYVYLLKSGKDDGYYIGYSNNLKYRYREHCLGKVESTKDRRPMTLIYYESYLQEDLARQREHNLKSFGSAYAGLLKRLGYK